MAAPLPARAVQVIGRTSYFEVIPADVLNHIAHNVVHLRDGCLRWWVCLGECASCGAIEAAPLGLVLSRLEMLRRVNGMGNSAKAFGQHIIFTCRMSRQRLSCVQGHIRGLCDVHALRRFLSVHGGDVRRVTVRCAPPPLCLQALHVDCASAQFDIDLAN